MSNVSKENLRKVESYFIDQVKTNGSNRTEATVVDIADGSGVALATAHKALKELDQRGVLTIIKPSSRRFPITYIYTGDIEGFEVAQSTEEQIEYLKDLVQERDEEIALLKEQLRLMKANSNSGLMLQEV